MFNYLQRNTLILKRLFNNIYSSSNLITMSKFSSSKNEISTGSLMVDERIIWMDLEMTGLDINCHHILEVGCLITDKNLNTISKGLNIVINQPDVILKNMNPWCIEHHGQSGLTDLSRKSKISLKMAEMEVLSYVRQHTQPGKCPLAGNTVHEDKKFLGKYMPELNEHFNYRIIDVSSIKELCKRWYPEEFRNAPKKNFSHRSLEDINESISELLYYRQAIFKH